MKNIADDAGLATEMGLRCFGAEEQQHLEALSPLESWQRHVALRGPETLGAALVERILCRPGMAQDGTLEEAFVVAAHYHDPTELASPAEALAYSLAARLEGPDARLRAELATAQMLGLAVLEGVLPTLAESAPGDIVRLFGPALQAVLDNSTADGASSKADNGAKT
ncbi:hypothetical protein [Streptomyces sp. CA-251247]|uniref:TetR/AcrR family transcriptional regulator n=1 Tax=Streptomyces sp. CA-251247 TaxID=3240062 RepID=UPI003D934E64